jgi:hypothetical protein
VDNLGWDCDCNVCKHLLLPFVVVVLLYFPRLGLFARVVWLLAKHLFFNPVGVVVLVVAHVNYYTIPGSSDSSSFSQLPQTVTGVSFLWP